MILASILVLAGLQQTPAPAPAGIRCRIDAAEDTQKSKMVAYTYLVPDGWNSHHAMSWVLEDSFAANLAVSTPDKLYSVAQLEPLMVNYNEPKSGAATGIHVVHASDFLHFAIDQLKRQFGVANLKVIDELNEPLKDAAEAGKPTTGADVRSSVKECGYLKAGFQVGGQAEVAELATTVTGYNLQSGSTGSTVGSYQVGPTTMIVMPAKPDPQKLKELQLIVSSMNATSQFLDYLRKVVMPSAPQDKAPLDKQFWLLRSMAGYCELMASKDPSTRRFCGLISGEGSYRTKDGSIVTLPTSYGHVWADGAGDFVFSDTPPAKAAAPDGAWQELQKG